MEHFLLAYDGSESAQQAAAMATDMAKKYGAAVRVISVGDFRSEQGRVEAEKRAQRLAEEGAATLTREGVAATAVVRVGDPAVEILRAVDEENCSLIIMGHRGVTPSRIWVLGSVALKVINHATCPVLVVRDGSGFGK
jgi:nucleotide-binding universal stress UspA family protein